MNQKLKIGSLFSGYGGLDEAVKQVFDAEVGIPERVATRIKTNWSIGPNGCHNWEGAIDSGGYGNIAWHVDGKPSYAKVHRLAWALSNGQIPDGYQIDHTCFNRRCINPGHLRQVTKKQNQEHLRGATARNKSSGVRGVYLDKRNRTNPWTAQLRHNGKTVRVGSFPTIEAARRAVEAKRSEVFTHDDYLPHA